MVLGNVMPTVLGCLSRDNCWMNSVTLGRVYDSCLSGARSVMVDFVSDAVILRISCRSLSLCSVVLCCLFFVVLSYYSIRVGGNCIIWWMGAGHRRINN